MKNNYINVALIMGAGIIAGALNYAYYPLMLQYMSLEDFGVFGGIMGILNLIGVISGGIILFLNKEISKNITDISKVKHIYLSSLGILATVGIIGFMIFGLLSPLFALYFKIQEIGYFWLVGITIIISLASTAVMATLRGLKKFNFIAVTQVVNPLLKVSIGIALVMYGFNIYGAIYGVVLSGILGILISMSYLGVMFRSIKREGTTKELLQDFKSNKKELGEFFLISLFFAIFMNIDVIFVQNIFDSTLAGAYVGVAVLGKFLIFLLLSIETAYYGQILEQKKESLPYHLIKNPLILMSITIVCAIGFNILFGKYILHILKPELESYVFIYIISLVYYGLLVYISFFSKILVAWGVFKANKILGFFIVLLIGLVYTLGNQSLEAFIYCFIAIAILCNISLGAVFVSEIKK